MSSRPSPLVVPLPRRFDVRTMYDVIGAAIGEDQQPRAREIDFDFSSLTFADPSGMTVISNLMKWLHKRGVTGMFKGINVSNEAIRYMDDCGFFNEYTGNPIRGMAEVRRTTIPFTAIVCEEAHPWLDNTVFPWLASRLNTTTASLAEFKTCLREIYQNIKDHSTEEIGCTHIQYFSSNKRVVMSISDFGVGIPVELGRVYQNISDSRAISLAVMEGISSKVDGHNKGAGLSYLVDNVVRRNQGTIGIYSNRGQFTCGIGGDGRIFKSPRLASGFYPGTLITICLRTDRIEKVEERENLEW